MATTLIDTRKPIMEQIHASWNEYRRTEEGMLFMFGSVGSNYNDYNNIPLAKDFAKDDAPWSTKQSVLERNAVHANKLIRLYISLNIDVERRIPICLFFETGVVSEIKEQIKLLKRIQKVLKLEQELEVHEPLPSATSLFTHTGNLSLDEIEDDFKINVKEAKKMEKIKEQKKRNAALKRAKKRQARKDSEKRKREEKKVVAWIEATKHSKRDMLKMWKVMERDGYTIRDVIEELERQLD